jgi:hypothetical protein
LAASARFIVGAGAGATELFNSALISAEVIVSSTKVNVPFSFISLAALRKAPIATLESAAPRLIRRAPAATRSATGKLSPLIPARAFTGFGATAAQTARIASRLGRPGA